MSEQPADGKVEARVTMFEDPIRVDPDEVEHLRREGLLVEDEAAEAAVKPSRGRNSGSGGGGGSEANGGTPAE